VWVGVAAIMCFSLVGHLSASPQNNHAKHTNTPATNRPDILFVQTPVLLTGQLARRFPQGSAIVRLNLSSPKHGLTHLTEGFFAAADPQMNFDATKVLFSARKTQSDHWQIWEMHLDGSHKRQVTRCDTDCLRAAYLPSNEVAFTVEESRRQQLFSYLAVAKLDGSGMHPITFGSAPFQLETVLRDGRIVASAPWPLRGSTETGGTRILYTLRPDGTALESIRCEHRAAAIQNDAEELTDGSIVFVRRSIVGGPTGGELVDLEQGASDVKPLSIPQAIYDSPRQLSENELIIAKQGPTATNAPGQFDLYVLDLKSGVTSRRVYSDAKLSSIQPTPFLPHPTPKRYWDTLNPELSTGNFISLNSYLSADEMHGHIETPISRVRVFSLNSWDGQELNWGEAPVEPDGSFFVKVPANAPVRFVLLDAKGQIIREEHGWVWARPGEERGCTGCHGDKAIAPDNRWPQTLRRFDTPTPLGESEHGRATAQAK
jgi:hypothetical protein